MPRKLRRILLAIASISLIAATALALAPRPCRSLDCAQDGIPEEFHFKEKLGPTLHEAVSTSDGRSVLVVRTRFPVGEATLYRDGSKLNFDSVTFNVTFPYCCAPPSVAIADDGRYFAIAVNSLYLYSGESGDLVWRYDLSGGDDWLRYFTSVAVSPDGRFMAAASELGILYFFSTERPQPLWTANIARGSWPRLAMTPDGRFIAVTSGNLVLLFSAAEPNPVHTWRVGAGLRYAEIAVSSDGTWAAVTSDAGDEITVYKLSRNSEAPDWKRSLGRGFQPFLSITSDGSALVTANLGSGTLDIMKPSGHVTSAWSFGRPIGRPSLIGGGDLLGFGVSSKTVFLDWRENRILGWIEGSIPVFGAWGTPEHLFVLSSPTGGYAGEMWLRCMRLKLSAG